MTGKKKGKFLILSISLLALIIIIYSYSKGRVQSAQEEGGRTAATVVKETSIKIYNAVSEKMTEAIERAKERKAAREAEKAAKKAREEALKETTVLGASNETDVPDTGTFESSGTSPGTAESTEPETIIFTASDGSRYVTLTENSEVRYLRIPEKVSETEFRQTEDTVYASKAAKLYGNPDFTGGALLTAGKWEAFTRVGISNDCCYQLVTAGGQIVYADGVYFRRYREDMETTEEIDLTKERVELSVEHISQLPELPTGCEITSLATVLNYYGFDADKMYLAQNYLPKGEIGEANFFDEFVGDPTNDVSFGCYAGAIVTAANKYLEEKGSEERAVDYTGSSFESLLRKVREGNPVIVWISFPLEEEPSFTHDWIVDGEYLVWKANLHCVVLTGYDTIKDTVIVSDPLESVEEYDMALFIKRFKQLYSQAVIIE